MKVLEWIKQSNRWKHILGGVLLGAGANDLYCACYAGLGVAAALELKDYLWGGKPDWVDFLCTVTGVGVGFGIRTLIAWRSWLD